MSEAPVVRVCFVCHGNICRSPTAEGVMLQLVERAGLRGRIAIDSAGVSGEHEGERADPRSRAVAEARGVPLPSRARRFVPADFDRFDLVVAMDRDNRRRLLTLTRDAAAAKKVVLLGRFEPGVRDDDGAADVPDPWYGGPAGFDEVFDQCERGCAGLLAFLREHHGLA